jgi:6-phosphogluconolactonase
MQASKIQAGFAALSIAVLLMSACGGGGGGGTTTGTTTVLSAYVANYGDGTISQYTINPTTGALTPKSPATVCSMIVSSICNANSIPTSVAVDPTGRYAYVANSGDYVISQFTVGSGGALQPMNPATVPSGSGGPTSIAIDPSGKYAYVANSSSHEVVQFTIGVGGALSTPSSMVPLGTTAFPGPVAIAVDPTGKYVYVVDQGSNLIEQFSIVSGGGLQPMSTSTVSTGTNSYPISIGFDPAGTNAYVVNYGNFAGSAVKSTITQYSIAAANTATPGALTPASTAIPTLLNNATSIVIDHAGTYAYVANGSGLYQLPINNSDGSLNTSTSIAPIVTGGTTPQSVAIDSSGKFVYVANQIGNNGISATGSVSQFNVGSGFVYAQDVPAGNQAYFITTAVSIQ